MRCPECRRKMNGKDAACPTCGHEFSKTELKKAKRKRRSAIWIPTGIVLGIILLFAIAIIVPTPQVKNIRLDKTQVENLDSLSVTVTCENLGYIETEYPVSLYIDNQIVETVNFELEANSAVKKTVIISSDELQGPGQHTLSVEDSEAIFNVLEPAEFVYSYDAEPQPFAVGTEYQIAYTVKNIGPSTGTADYTITMEGVEIKKGSVQLGPNESRTDVAYISNDISGECDLCINDEPIYAAKFYDVTSLENGYRLMENTVKGYSYIDITNNTGFDMILYLAKEENPTTAVAARYVQDGKRHSMNSIMHGEYILFVQTGELFMPQAMRFGEDEKFFQSGIIDFGNNVRNGAGFYEYIKLTLNPGDLTRYFDRVGEVPNIP